MTAELRRAASFALTFDLWVGVHSQDYLCITVSFVDESFRQQTRTLSLLDMTGKDHSGNDIAAIVKGELERAVGDSWRTKLVSVATDNGSNMVAAVSKLAAAATLIHVRCIAHSVDLSARCWAREPTPMPGVSLEASLGRVFSFLRWLRDDRRRKMYIDLANDRSQNKIEDIGPAPSYAPTRWMSCVRTLIHFNMNAGFYRRLNDSLTDNRVKKLVFDNNHSAASVTVRRCVTWRQCPHPRTGEQACQGIAQVAVQVSTRSTACGS